MLRHQLLIIIIIIIRLSNRAFITFKFTKQLQFWRGIVAQLNALEKELNWGIAGWLRTPV